MNKPEWGSRRTLSTGTVIEYSEQGWLGGVAIRPDGRWEYIGTVGGEWFDALGQCLYYLSNDQLDLEEYSGKLLPLLPSPALLSADRDTRIVEAWELLCEIAVQAYRGDVKQCYIGLDGNDPRQSRNRVSIDLMPLSHSVPPTIDDYTGPCEITVGVCTAFQTDPAVLTRAANILQVLQSWLAEVQK